MTRSIPQREWHDFFVDLTDDNQGRKATIQVGDAQIGDGSDDDRFVLTGIEAGVMAESDDTVVVELADMEGDEQGHVTHRFEHVSDLRVDEQDGGVNAIEIDTREGTHARITLGEDVPILETGR